MKKFGPKRKLETKYLYCNNHGECEHVESGIKNKKWKCCYCTVDYSNAYRKKVKEKAVQYKGGMCELCGYSKSIVALVFHHVNPILKDYELSGAWLCKSWDKLVVELDKCQLLCFNCHHELHYKIDKKRQEENKKIATTYHKKLIHKINCKKLGKQPSL